MIIDHRVYTCAPNKLPLFAKLYEEEGLPLQRKYLGEPIGFYQTHIGALSRLVHLWQYESLADRETRRDMRNEILTPVSFFQPKGQG